MVATEKNTNKHKGGGSVAANGNFLFLGITAAYHRQ